MRSLVGILAVLSGICCGQQVLGNERDQRPNRVIANFGVGSPTGSAGLTVERMLTREHSIEAGVGEGVTGINSTANTRWYYGSKKIRGNVLLGTSYSTGRKVKHASKDNDKDGKIGHYGNIPDALWLNLSTGYDVTTGSGFIIGGDIGLTGVVASGMARKKQDKTEKRICEYDCLFYPDIKPGYVVPSITFLRVGYAF